MRVLHLGKYFPPEPGGMERFLDALTLQQQRDGLQTAVLVHDRTRSGEEFSESRHIIRCRSHGQLLFAPVAPTWPLRLRGAIVRQQPDLLHLHLPNPSVFAALGLPEARRLPWVAHWHADIPLDTRHLGLRLAYPLYARMENLLLRRCQRIIATSEAYLAASAPLAGLTERCEVVPLALNDSPPAGTSARWPGPGLRVLAVGRLSYYKGFDRLITAISRIEQASLLIAGDGDQRARLERLISELNLGGRVRIEPGLDDADLEATYRACDAVCLPSLDRAEAFGLVLLEAMRAARPVIASRVEGSGMSEVVVDEGTGLQVPPDSPDALAAAIARLAADAPLRQRLGEAGAVRYRRDYDLARVSAQVTKIYRELLQAG